MDRQICSCGSTSPRPPEPRQALHDYTAIVTHELAAAAWTAAHRRCHEVALPRSA